MLAAIRSGAVLGIEACDVTVEVEATQGLPQRTIVGLPVGAAKESRERVGSALVNSGFTLPPPESEDQSRAGGCPQGRHRVRCADCSRNTLRLASLKLSPGPDQHDTALRTSPSILNGRGVRIIFYTTDIT